MQLMLEDAGHFSSQCNVDEDELPCTKQSATLLNVQLIAGVGFLFSPLVGAGIDKYGPSVMICAFIFGTAGYVILTIATALGIDWMLFPSFVCMGCMSTISGLFTVQTGLLFKPGRSRDRVISGLSAVEDAGGMTYLMLWYLSKNTGVALPAICGVYLGVFVIIMGIAVTCWTKIYLHEASCELDAQDTLAKQHDRSTDSSMKTISETAGETMKDKDGAMSQDPSDEFVENESPDQSHVESSYIMIAQRPPSKQLLSSQYIALAIFFAFHDARNTWVVTTMRDFLASLGDDEVSSCIFAFFYQFTINADFFTHICVCCSFSLFTNLNYENDQVNNKYLSIFTVLTPISILGVPFVDIILHKYGYAVGLHVVNILGIAQGVVQVSSTNLSVQVIGFVIYSFYRCFVYSMTFSFLPTFLSIGLIGKGCGFLDFFASVSSFIINIPLSNVTMNQLEGNFFVPNMIYLCGCIPCAYLCEILRRGIEKERLKEDELGRLSLCRLSESTEKSSRSSTTKRRSTILSHFRLSESTEGTTRRRSTIHDRYSGVIYVGPEEEATRCSRGMVEKGRRNFTDFQMNINEEQDNLPTLPMLLDPAKFPQVGVIWELFFFLKL